MATKICPSCDAEVPVAAARCKECFHDFTVVRRRNYGPLVLLGMLALMAVIGVGTLGAILLMPTDQEILVDEESEQIVFVRKYWTGESTDKIPFSEISALEHVITASGDYQTVAVKRDGSKVVLTSARKSLKGMTEHQARVMDKPWREIDNTTGFFSKESVEKLEEAQTRN